MNDSEPQDVRRVSDLRKGEQVSFWPERFTEVIDIRVEAGRIWVLTSSPITGLPMETEYAADDLVLVKKGDILSRP